MIDGEARLLLLQAKELWPRLDVNGKRGDVLAGMMLNYDREEFDRALHTWATDHPDAKAPKWLEIQRICEGMSRGSDACEDERWNYADETQYAHLTWEYFVRKGQPDPGIGYVCRQLMGREPPPVWKRQQVLDAMKRDGIRTPDRIEEFYGKLRLRLVDEANAEQMLDEMADLPAEDPAMELEET